MDAGSEVVMYRPHPLWETDQSLSPPSFLPATLDKTGFIDVTSVGDAFRRYLDPRTGKVHDGAEYHRRFCEQTPPIPPPSRLLRENGTVSSTAPRRERATMHEGSITIDQNDLQAALTEWDAEALAGKWPAQPELTSEQRAALNADLLWKKLTAHLPV